MNKQLYDYDCYINVFFIVIDLRLRISTYL